MIQSRKEAAEMTALATRFTRCHLIQLNCWAKINSPAMTSALFLFLYFYIDKYIFKIFLCYIYLFLSLLFPPCLCVPYYSNWFISFQSVTIGEKSGLHKFIRKLVYFLSSSPRGEDVFIRLVLRACFFEACRNLLRQQVCQENTSPPSRFTSYQIATVKKWPHFRSCWLFAYKKYYAKTTRQILIKLCGRMGNGPKKSPVNLGQILEF